jgi:hypothetical protein
VIGDGPYRDARRCSKLRADIRQVIRLGIPQGAAVAPIEPTAYNRQIVANTAESGAPAHLQWRREWIGLLIVAAVSLAIRLPWIHQPIRDVEAAGWLEYSSQPLTVTVTKFEQPDNHVLYNLCTAIAVRSFGPAEWAIRVTSLVAGVLTSLLAAWLTYSITRPACDGPWLPRFAALQSGVCIAVSSHHVEYSALGVGYTLEVCLAMICWIAARQAVLSRSLVLGGVAIVAAALGWWTMPVMVYPLVMITFLLLWDPALRETPSGAISPGAAPPPSREPMSRRELWRWLSVGWIAAIALAGLLYLPAVLVGGASPVLSHLFKEPMPLEKWLGMWGDRVLSGQSFTWRDVPIPVRCFWIFGIVGIATRPDRWSMRGLLACSLVVPIFVMPLLLRVHPPSRVWLYLMPILAVFTAWGWCGRLRTMRSPMWRGILQVVVVGAMLIWPAVNLFAFNSISKSNELGAAPAAREAAEFLKRELQPDDVVLAVRPASAPLRYYASRFGIDDESFDVASDAQFNDAVVVLTEDEATTQSVDSVLAELRLSDQLQNWSREEIWSRPGMKLYRLTRP